MGGVYPVDWWVGSTLVSQVVWWVGGSTLVLQVDWWVGSTLVSQVVWWVGSTLVLQVDWWVGSTLVSQVVWWVGSTLVLQLVWWVGSTLVSQVDWWVGSTLVLQVDWWVGSTLVSQVVWWVGSTLILQLDWWVGSTLVFTHLYSSALIHRCASMSVHCLSCLPFPGGGDGVTGDACGHKVGWKYSREGVKDASTLWCAIATVTSPSAPQESLKQYQRGDLQQFDLTQLILTVYCAKVMEVSGRGASP